MDIYRQQFSLFNYYHIKLFLLFSFCVSSTYSQKQIYKSSINFSTSDKQNYKTSLSILQNKILFNAKNYRIYAINKDSLKTVWETYIGWKSNVPRYLYKKIFFYVSYENEINHFAQYDLTTEKKIKKLPFESIKSKNYFVNNIMYCTALADGGKLLAYNLEENKIIWQLNIGHRIDLEPVDEKDKIIANKEADNWFEIDYNGNLLKSKSNLRISIDTTAFFVKKYKFLTHDGKEISEDFLNKNKVSKEDYQTKTNHTNTFILTENQLLVLGNNKKNVLQLDLETAFAIDNFNYSDYNSILTINLESIWFCYQNQLIHYDFKNNKLLRKVDLSQWNPHQVVIENRTIRLIPNTT